MGVLYELQNEAGHCNQCGHNATLAPCPECNKDGRAEGPADQQPSDDAPKESVCKKCDNTRMVPGNGMRHFNTRGYCRHCGVCSEAERTKHTKPSECKAARKPCPKCNALGLGDQSRWWATKVDPKTGHTYYVDKKTGRSQWERPEYDFCEICNGTQYLESCWTYGKRSLTYTSRHGYIRVINPELSYEETPARPEEWILVEDGKIKYRAEILSGKFPSSISGWLTPSGEEHMGIFFEPDPKYACDCAMGKVLLEHHGRKDLTKDDDIKAIDKLPAEKKTCKKCTKGVVTL